MSELQPLCQANVLDELIENAHRLCERIEHAGEAPSVARHSA
jgi:hypothetical protein